MKLRVKAQIALHLFVGLGAVAGGLAAIFNPIDPLGAPLHLLDGSPFHSYFLIGIFLAGVIGGGNLTSSILVWKFPIVGNIASLGMGIVLMLWIVIQCIIIKSIIALHIIFFLIGLVQSIWAFLTLRKTTSLTHNPNAATADPIVGESSIRTKR